jgi:putative lipoprotein
MSAARQATLLLILIGAALAAPAVAQQGETRSVQRGPTLPGNGSIRYAERDRAPKSDQGRARSVERGRPIERDDRNAERGREGEREVTRGREIERESRDREVRRGDSDASRHESRSFRRGESITRLPERSEKLEVSGRTLHRSGDHYFVEHEGDRGRSYVVVDPPLGASLTRIPTRHERVYYGGAEFYLYDDVYYQPRLVGGRTTYVVVEPPLGATIRRLPDDHQFVVVGGQRLCRWGGLYFKPIYLGGFLVYVRIEPPPPPDACVSGAVAYRERIMLPRDAVVMVELLELTRFGTVRRSVGKQAIHRPRLFPVPFEICVDAREIDPSREYAIDAYIVTGGRTRWICEGRARVLTSGRPNRVEVRLRSSR